MLSENNRLQKRSLGQDSQTTKDYQNTMEDGDTLYNAISIGLMAGLGYGAYKTGLLKDIARPLLEVADKIAREGTDKASVTMSTIKEWAQLKHLTSDQLRLTNQRWNAATNSIFRERDSSFFYDLASDLKKSVEQGRVDFSNIRKLMRGTTEDFQTLADMIKDAQKRLPDRRQDFTNTDLFHELSGFKAFKINTQQNATQQSVMFNAKYMEELMSKMSLSPEKAQQQLKESGYRSLTLGDLLEYVSDEKGKRLVLKQNAPIDLASKKNKQGVSLVDDINYIFRNEFYMKDGKRTNAFTGDWKNIIIDNNIKISESGKVIDYRMTADSVKGFKRSLATDFKIPLVQFNPFKVLLGWDKTGRRSPIGGLLKDTQIDPSLTGKVGRTTIGEWLAETYGEEYRHMNVAVINGNAYIGDASNPNQIKKIATGLKLEDITYAEGAYGLKPLDNAERQMARLDLGSPKKISWDDYEAYLKEKGVDTSTFQKYKYKIGQFLDLGYQEVRPAGYEAEGFDTTVNIDELVNKFIYWGTSKNFFRTNGYEYDTIQEMFEYISSNGYSFKTAFGQGFDSFTRESGRKFNPHMYKTRRARYKFGDIFKAENSEEAWDATKKFFGQFNSGRRTFGNPDEFGEYYTEASGMMWTIMNQLSEGLASSSPLLGLSTDNKNNWWTLAGNLILRRALPVYAALQIPEMINYFSEPFMGEDSEGNQDNITKFLMRNVLKPIDIGAHHAMDLVGVSGFFKNFQEMTPGSDQLLELPGVYHLGLTQTGEERKEYIEEGYDPVRKGRYWGSGNTPFTGGKIMYFRPNIYRRVEADVKFSDSKWGSRQEYYSNTWYPNPVNPFAPINYFLLDRNHYDEKHYHDRPYLQTSPVGSNIPIIGPLFGSTIGTIISPPQKMHMEYWANGLQPIPGDEEPVPLLTEGKVYTRFDNSRQDVNTYRAIEQQAAADNQVYQQALYSSAYHAKQVTKRTIQDNAGITFQESNILPLRSYDRYGNSAEVYTTPSGAMNIVDIPDEYNLYNVNQDLKEYSINKIIGTDQRMNLIDEFQGPGIPVGNDNETIDNMFITSVGEQFNVLSDVAGLKGFALQGFVTGEANTDARVIENSSYAYSMNKSFWDQEFGGLGGNLSEIARRFIPKRNNNIEYINPIRNTMPSWMPGSDYFTDFKHGDPYSKIENGEERLPGEGYERLHGIKGLMDFNIGSSSIGYSKEQIIQHFLKSDKYMSTFEDDTLETGNKLHEAIEKQWLKDGIAFHTEGEIKDKRNGIIGYYDAMVYDPTSETGVGIVDIKSTSAKKLEEIRKSGQPLDHHKRQVNYYLWGTNNTASNGYVFYVDKENPNNNYTTKFQYDEELLEDTLNNVYAARKELRDAVDKGIIGRGELYDPIDKLRILADVAPYSQELKDVQAELSFEKLSVEEQEEVSAINDRITQQKEPLRVYPYKFKTSNLKSETVTVTKIIDNNTIVTREYGKEHAIKFAGINVSESNTEYHKQWKEKYTDKKGRERERTTGITKNQAASNVIHKYLKPGSKIRISYDVDENNKYSGDSTRSIRAVVHSRGKNINRVLLDKDLAKEKENDESPAAIQARYSKGEIAFGSAMETLTHDVIGNIPFIGSKVMQVRSPYEQYRRREVYGKDFQSWNHPIRDIAIPNIQEQIGNDTFGGLAGILVGGFVGSMFGNGPYGKIIGTVLGASIPAIGKLYAEARSTDKQDWRPQRRIDQEELNEYVDILKYVKNMRLYEKYKQKAKAENNFDVDNFMQSQEAQGVSNKLRSKELNDYKRKVKLDFKHRGRYNFKYGKPKYADLSMDKETTISAINQELAEIQGDRKAVKVPTNALLAIDFKQQADKTMYAFEPGDSLVNIMSALPKKERQYFKHFMDAPEEEKDKILRIAPSYLRRALQASWGMPVDRKPSLQEYFQNHGLPDVSWIGWSEGTNIEDVKVKLIHQNELDPGEFDVWDANQEQADSVNIPIPMMNANNTAAATHTKLNQILGKAGYENIQITYGQSNNNNNNTKLIINRDARDSVEQQINTLEI